MRSERRLPRLSPKGEGGRLLLVEGRHTVRLPTPVSRETPAKINPMKNSATDRKERLAAALRENLKKRKARERALAAGEAASSGDTPGKATKHGPNAAKKDG